ncbi:MAG TPA: O-antigen ligase family protein [Thermoleophilaceae bacterium]|nr:O-antigen ligase family protein [Thermoleophilaceae bacterium]
MSERLAGAWITVPAAVLAALVATASAFQPVVALAAVAGLAVAAMVLASPVALVLALVASFPWDDMLAVPTETVSAVKILGALVLLGYVIRLVASDEPVVLAPPLAWLAGFTVLVLLATLSSSDLVASLAKTTRYVLFASFFFVYVQLVRSRTVLRATLQVLLLSLAAAALVGVYGFLTKGHGLAQGPVGDPNDFAYLLATALPLGAYLIVSEQRHRWLWVLVMVPIGAALLATLSRGALVGLLALVVWALWTRRLPVSGLLAAGATTAAALALAFALWGPLIGERVQAKDKVAAENVQSREALWKGALRMAADRPLVGVGPGRFGDLAPGYVVDQPLVYSQPVVHNSYLEILAELGILALLAFLGFLASSWRQARLAIARAERVGDVDGVRLGTALQASLVVALVAGAFISAQVIIPIWLLCALAIVAASTGERPVRAP